MEDMKNLFSSLDELMKDTKLDDVTAEGTGFDELPDGYYLSELEKAEIKESKSSHQPMVALQFKIVEDGIGTDDKGENTIIPKTKNRKIFMYYVLKDERSLKRFVGDMLKFEGETAGEPLLEKECFTSSELLNDALDIIIGHCVYIQSSTTENDDGSNSVWKNLISWKRAQALELKV